MRLSGVSLVVGECDVHLDSRLHPAAEELSSPSEESCLSLVFGGTQKYKMTE